MTLKNVWSLNVDEALVADEISHKLGKTKYEVFFPANAQLKNIDLLLYDLEKTTVKTIQVKGSRTWEPSPIERKRYGEGSSSWIIVTKKSVDEPTNKVDFYIVVLHNLIDSTTKKIIKINYLIIPNVEFKRICSEKKANKVDDYHFYIWIDDKGKRAFDFHDDKNKPIPMDKYLDNWKILQI